MLAGAWPEAPICHQSLPGTRILDGLAGPTWPWLIAFLPWQLLLAFLSLANIYGIFKEDVGHHGWEPSGMMVKILPLGLSARINASEYGRGA